MEKVAPETQTPETSPAPCNCGQPLSFPIVALITLVALVVGGGTGYYFGNKSSVQTQTQVQTQDQIQQETEQIDSTTNWDLYTSKDKTYQLQYPVTLKVYEYENDYSDHTSILLHNINNPPSLNKLSQSELESATSIQINSYPNFIIPETFPYTNGSTENETIENIVIGSYQGIKGKRSSIIAKVPEQVVMLENPNGGYIEFILQIGKTSLFDQILETFEFLE